MNAFAELSYPSIDVRFSNPPKMLSRYDERSLSLDDLLQANANAVATEMSGRKWSIEAEASQLAYFGVNRVFIFDRARSQIALSQLAFTWKRHLLNPHASSDVDTISETVEYAFEALSQFGPSAINLNGLTVNQVQGEHLAAVLRMTYPWRAETPGWIAALGIAKTALALVGVDYRSALIGLLEAGA